MPAPSQSIRLYRFGVYEFDPAAKELRKNGLKLRIGAQPSEILCALLERAGAIVSRDELRTRLWPEGVHVDYEHNLNKAMNRLREVLRDSADQPRYVETLPKVGYRFLAPVDTVPASETQHDTEPRHASTPVAAVRGRRWPMGAAAITAAILVLVAFLNIPSRDGAEVPLGSQPVPLTAMEGRETSVSFAPDGSAVAFVSDTGGNVDIYRMTIGGAAPVRVTEDVAPEYSPAWSRDGSRIAYLRDLGAGRTGVYFVNANGGQSKQIATVASPPSAFASYSIPHRNLTWTKDGLSVITADAAHAEAPHSLVRLAISGGGSERLTDPPPGMRGDLSPAISPDGQQVAFLRGGVAHSALRVAVMDLAAKRVREVPVAHPWIDGLTWAHDGSALVVSAARTLDGSRVLLRVGLDGTSPRPLAGLEGVEPAVAPGGRLAYTRLDTRRTTVWALRLKAAGQAASAPELLTGSTTSNMDVDVSPDGRMLAFRSLRSGKPEVWVSAVDGSGLRPLADLGAESAGNPRWSPDGAFVALHARVRNNSDIYVVSVDGREKRLLTEHPANDIYPRWSRDGKSLLFGSDRDGSQAVYRVSAGGGAAQKVQPGALCAIEAPDERLVFTSAARRPAISWPGTEGLFVASPCAFSASRTGVYYMAAPAAYDGSTEVRFVAWGATNPRIVLRTARPAESGISVTPDDSLLVLSQLDQDETTLMLAEGFR